MMCRGGVHEGLGCMQRWSARKVKCKGGVHARLGSGAAPNPNAPRARTGPVRISVAYGNIPAPGLGKLERASQESLRIVCGCLAESVAVKENLTNFKKIVKNIRREQK